MPAVITFHMRWLSRLTKCGGSCICKNMDKKKQKDKCVIGVISDTHGFLRPGVLKAFADVEHILHAGDLDTPRIIAELESIAPVTAVRGNMDHGSWALDFPEHTSMNMGGWDIKMMHIPPDTETDNTKQRTIVIHGHTHTPREEWVDGTLMLNPGSAGPKRSHRIPTVALLHLAPDHAEVEFIELN